MGVTEKEAFNNWEFLINRNPLQVVCEINGNIFCWNILIAPTDLRFTKQLIRH